MSDKVYLATQIKGMDYFEDDMMKLLKPEHQFSRYDFTEELIEEIKEANIEGSQIKDYYIEAEKTISNKSINFRFNVTDEDMILSINYLGYDE